MAKDDKGEEYNGWLVFWIVVGFGPAIIIIKELWDWFVKASI